METYIKVEHSSMMLFPGDEYYRTVNWSLKDPDEVDLFSF